jgi:SAM-dependent methyltransferase
MISDPKCRLCGHARHHPFLCLSGMPRWNHRLLSSTEKALDHGINLQVIQCEACGFVSLPVQLDDNYYDSYMLVPSRSTQAQAFQIGEAQAFVSRFGLRDRPVLEVGCGDGFFLAALRDAGAQAFGIEPSREQCALARSRGLRVEQGLLTPDRLLKQAPFAGFATRQVFEHVEDMRGFLLAIRANLTPQAVGLVEVPNLDTLVAQGRFFDFIPEHIN